MKDVIEKVKNRICDKKGYSLGEALICVLLLLLVSGTMAEGIRFAIEQYQVSMELSQAEVLKATLETKITNTLQDIPLSQVVTVGEKYPLLGTQDKGKNLLPDNSYGYVVSRKKVGSNLSWVHFLPLHAYTYDMKANAKITHYPAKGEKYYTVDLLIQNRSGKELSKTRFDVMIYD